jgi:hypothetical protein
MPNDKKQSELNIPNLDMLAKAGSKAVTSLVAPSERVDISHLYGEHGGLLRTSPTAGGEPVDISHLYGEHGGLVWAPPTIKSSDDESRTQQERQKGKLQVKTDQGSRSPNPNSERHKRRTTADHPAGDA